MAEITRICASYLCVILSELSRLQQNCKTFPCSADSLIGVFFYRGYCSAADQFSVLSKCGLKKLKQFLTTLGQFVTTVTEIFYFSIFQFQLLWLSLLKWNLHTR